jgi:hypothetical protein
MMPILHSEPDILGLQNTNVSCLKYVKEHIHNQNIENNSETQEILI